MSLKEKKPSYTSKLGTLFSPESLSKAVLVAVGALLGTGGTLGTQTALSSNTEAPAQSKVQILQVEPKCPIVKVSCPDVYIGKEKLR